MDKWIWSVGAVLVTTTLVTGFACSSDDESGEVQSGAVSLELVDFSFQPKEFSGETSKPIQVTLKNQGENSHTFTIDELDINEEVAAGSEKTVTLTPNATGDLTFYCRFHQSSQGMEGTLEVSGGSSAASPTESSGNSNGGDGLGY